jgi:choline dehydrogenase
MGQLTEADYLVIGAGSAGCVLANRLTENNESTVTLVEAGGPDRWWNWKVHMPSALAYPLADNKYNWAYFSEPEKHLDGRRMYCPRGKIWGGSSSINGMAYVRGHALDYERWSRVSGCEGWSYSECLPYFKKAESIDIGGDDYRGGVGPLQVTAGKMDNPLYRAWIDAGRQAGYPVTSDPNGYQQEGLGRMDMTVGCGRRSSAAQAYLRPSLKRKSLKIFSNTLVTKILIEGKRAVGVEIFKNGAIRKIFAAKEVILCAGAISTPQILMLSGIGPIDHLRDIGINIKHDLPGVGLNLQDHLEIYLQTECLKPISLFKVNNPIKKLFIGIQWMSLKKGLGATNHFEAGGFIRSSPGVKHPDIQHHFLPLAVNYDGTSPQLCHGYQVHVGPMRPTSRGYIQLRSNNPMEGPKITFNYMKTDQDKNEMREGIRLTREILAQPSFKSFAGKELSPGEGVQSDAEIDAFVRKNGESAYHPACSCRMGNDEKSVVNSKGKVHGMENLRIVDASIMPSIVSGNLNAPTIMMAEKIADDIRGKVALAKEDKTFWVHPDWQNKQR